MKKQRQRARRKVTPLVGNSQILRRLSIATPEQLKAVQDRLKRAANAADGFGDAMPRWKEAIEHLHDKPELLMDCNPMLAEMVGHGLDDAGVSNMKAEADR